MPSFVFRDSYGFLHTRSLPLAPPTRLGDLFGPHDWGIPPPHHRLYDAEAEETASRVRVYDPQRERWYNHRRR